jgi:hypothetical protein
MADPVAAHFSAAQAVTENCSLRPIVSADETWHLRRADRLLVIGEATPSYEF